MKIFLLSLALLCGACHSTDGQFSDSLSLQPVDAPFALEVKAGPVAPASITEEVLPRFNHLDRAQFAVRAWVRDRS